MPCWSYCSSSICGNLPPSRMLATATERQYFWIHWSELNIMGCALLTGSTPSDTSTVAPFQGFCWASWSRINLTKLPSSVILTSSTVSKNWSGEFADKFKRSIKRSCLASSLLVIPKHGLDEYLNNSCFARSEISQMVTRDLDLGMKQCNRSLKQI